MNNRIPPPLLGLALMGLAWWLDGLLPALRLAVPGLGGAAAALAALGIACILAGVLAFRAGGTTVDPLHPDRASTLVVVGIYRHTRNPMYVGILLVLAGWVVWLGQPVALLTLPLWVWFITKFQIRPEEAALHRRFGAAFTVYCQKVRRWV